MKSTKVAIFDIDKTIIRSDSMFQFVHYGVRRYPWQVWRLPVIALHTVLFKAGFMTVERVKRSYFQEIERMSEKDLEHFFDTRLRTSIFAEASVEMQHRKEAGYHVLLVTASPHAYMKYFKNFPWVDHVIGTELVRHANGYTCRIEGSNCKGEEKVRRIQAYLSEKNMIIDYDQSCSYSDSLSDLPVMQLVSQRYFINNSVPDMEALTWGEKKSRHTGKWLMLISALLTATGQLFWKWGLTEWIYLGVGFLCYGLGAILMIKAFALEKLSVAYPLMCASYVFALIYGYFLLGEAITVQKLAAVMLLGIGVTLTSVDR